MTANAHSYPPTPFAVAPRAFRFAALATAAAPRRTGGERETLMALFMIARLADTPTQEISAPPAVAPNREAIDERGEAMKRWLSSLSLPAPVADACLRCVEAWMAGDRLSLADSWRDLAVGTRELLDPSGISDVEAVSTLLG